MTNTNATPTPPPRKRRRVTNLGGQLVRIPDGRVFRLADWEGGDLQSKVLPVDTIGVVCGDPERCVNAHSFTRALTAAWKRPINAVIGNSKGYVIDWERELIWRFSVPRNDRAIQSAFDVQGYFPIGYTATLTQVRPNERLGARSKSRGRKDRSKTPTRTTRPRALATRALRFRFGLVNDQASITNNPHGQDSH